MFSRIDEYDRISPLLSIPSWRCELVHAITLDVVFKDNAVIPEAVVVVGSLKACSHCEKG